jgi:hypothetical protein
MDQDLVNIERELLLLTWCGVLPTRILLEETNVPVHCPK